MKFILILIIATKLFAALPSTEVKKGNQAAKSGQTDQAQYHYVKALENKADTSTVMYDLGNAMYDAGEFERAMKIYAGAIDSTRSPKQLGDAFYNMGTAGLQAKKYDEAVGAYIQALRQNPDDIDAKQNLELALRMKKQQQEQQKQDQQNQDQNKDQKDQQKQDQQKQDQQKQDQQKQDQQKQDQQKQDQQKQDQQKQDQQKQDQQKQDQQQQQQNQQQQGDSTQAQQAAGKPMKMTKEEAEQLLNALMQDEQNTLAQVRKAKIEQRKKRAKDW